MGRGALCLRADDPQAGIASTSADALMRYVAGVRNTSELLPGFKGPTCEFTWRAYEDRTPEEQADWRALRDSIRERGILNPLIVWGNRVLIGMRRWEIATLEGISTVPVCAIMEYPGTWHISDVRRLRKMLTDQGVWVRLTGDF